MEKIKVEIHWCDKNFCGGAALPVEGAVIATGKTLEDFKQSFNEALQFHINTLLNDGEDVPQWLITKDYEIEYDLDASALIRSAEEYTSITAISKATGINAKLLSHYANNVKKPRAAQRQRIVEGLHAIGRQLMGVL